MTLLQNAKRLLLCAVILTLVGCAHYVVNAEKTSNELRQEYRFKPEATGTNTNSLFICLIFSGGGTRAAAVSYGVLDKLKKTRITWKGVEKSLLE